MHERRLQVNLTKLGTKTALFQGRRSSGTGSSCLMSGGDLAGAVAVRSFDHDKSIHFHKYGPQHQ